MRALIATCAAIALAACLERHAPNNAIDETNCAGCHLAHYDVTTAPPHPGRFPTTCADCHVTAGWVPALAGVHPDDRFPIRTGAHAAARCLECHRLQSGVPSTGGADTDCLDCHPQAESDPQHVGIADYRYEPTERHFCLTCHPAGTAGHPEEAFPIASGPHEMPCEDCHRRDLGADRDGENTSCTGCHTGEHARGRVDNQHDEVRDYTWSDTNLHFCLECHPRGRQ